jgi:nitrite transporter NirC
MYIGFGIILIFSIGAGFASESSPAVRLVMGASFGIALSLVLFAGSELFTGNVMIFTFGLARKTVTAGDTASVWVFSWLGNLLGCLLLAFMIIWAGSIEHSYALFAKVSLMKINAPASELFFRGILCNMLVCLALWSALRTKSDAAKLIIIFWCLFGFIGTGYEHSIANMTLIAIGILANPDIADLTWSGFFYNSLWVTLGNIVGGGVFIAGFYLIASRHQFKTVPAIVEADTAPGVIKNKVV